jgi:hypothetical protein
VDRRCMCDATLGDRALHSLPECECTYGRGEVLGVRARDAHPWDWVIPQVHCEPGIECGVHL